jgi:acetyl esterase/lipase
MPTLPAEPPDAPPVRRGPLLITAALAAFGAAAIPAVTLPGVWKIWQLYAMLFGLLAVVGITTVIIAVLRPTRRTVLAAALAPALTLVLWVLDRVLGVLPAPDPWQPADTVLGITDYIDAALQLIAVLGLVIAAARGPRPQPSTGRWIAGWVTLLPLALVVLAASVVGVTTASDGFTGTGVPAAATAPSSLPAGRMSTVEYCRPAGIPLAMDIYTPATAAGPAPVALYIHGGGFILGNRKAAGAGTALANSAGALFGPVQRSLNARGFIVASIDYRLMPATAWPAPITDAKCAVRFLRAHAAALGIDPLRISAWGSSAGGVLASLLGIAGSAGGFDVGQYLEQHSAVSHVVDMFGPADLTDLSEYDAVMRTSVRIGFGSSAADRRAASPLLYQPQGQPSFLILQGEQDAAAHQTARFADRLRAAGLPVTYVGVQGTGHTLDTPGERPGADELAATVVDFLARA